MRTERLDFISVLIYFGKIDFFEFQFTAYAVLDALEILLDAKRWFLRSQIYDICGHG